MIDNIRLFFMAILIVVFSAAAFGHPPLTITESGYYYTEVDSDGNPKYVEITEVIDLTGDGDKPDKPDKPDLDPSIVENVQSWSEDLNDPDGAQGLITVYSTLKTSIKNNEVSISDVLETVLSKVSDCANKLVGNEEGWKKLRDENITPMLMEAKQRGLIKNKTDLLRYINSIQHGLERSVDDAPIINEDLRTKIVVKTNEVINEHK